MLRSLSMFTAVAALTLVGCTAANSPPASDDPAAAEDTEMGKDDSVPAASISPKLTPMLAFLKDDKNLINALGPEGTTAANLRRTIKVVRYTEFGRATDVAARAIARNYQVATTGSNYRRANGLLDLISVGDMYVTVKTGYGDDSFIDGAHPETWLSGLDITMEELITNELSVNLVFEAPETFETDDGCVARWVDNANGFTVDLASIKEELLGTLGTQDAVCAHYASQLATSEPGAMGDVSIAGSNGPGHRELVVCIGDLVAKCDLYGPADLDLEAARIGVYEFVAAALKLNM